MIPGIIAGAVRGGAGEWVTATQWTPDSGGFANWGGFTFRLIVPSSALVAGSKLRLTCRSADVSSITIASMYVGHAAGAGDSYDFESAPTQILFGGSAGVTIANSSEIVSDAATFAVNASKNLIISTYISNGRSCRIETLPGWTTRYKTGNDAATVDASGYSTSAYAASLVRKIEVFPP